MAGEKVFVVSVPRLQADISNVNRGLDEAVDIAVNATQQAMAVFAEDMIVKAQARINSVTGRLEASGVVQEAIRTENGISTVFGFNTEYAAIQDQGGVILPKNAQMLAIPLDAILTAAGASRFASPREEPGLELVPILNYLFLMDPVSGEAHWLLVPKVVLDGNKYLTGTVERERDKFAPYVAGQVDKALGGGGL